MDPHPTPDGEMKRDETPPRGARSWRGFSTRDGGRIRRAVEAERKADCPRCGAPLEAESPSRASVELVLGATAYDLACRPCRRFWTVVRHTERSLRLLRMRRLAAAVGGVDLPRLGASTALTPGVMAPR
jgi:hypothetical protein